MTRDRIIEFAVNEMTGRHGCHSIILFGSRSRADWTDESDYDLIGFKDEGEKARIAQMVDGRFLDASIYPLSEVVGYEKNFLSARQGTVLIEKNEFATRLLKTLDEILAKGPKPLPDDELQAVRMWIRKTLARVRTGDLEGNYRRAWLQYDLLESYFALRKQWFLGSKESFRWLSENDRETYLLFDLALKPNADLADIQRLAERILSD